MLPVQLDLPGTPFNSARKARDYILAAIKERVAEKKLEFERGSVKKDTLLAFYASAKADEGDPLDEHELAVSRCHLKLSGHSASGNMRELFWHFAQLAYQKETCMLRLSSTWPPSRLLKFACAFKHFPAIKLCSSCLSLALHCCLPADAAVAAADECPPADAGRQRHVPGRAQGAAGRPA